MSHTSRCFFLFVFDEHFEYVVYVYFSVTLTNVVANIFLIVPAKAEGYEMSIGYCMNVWVGSA